MSYKIDAANERMTGAFTGNYTYPFTIACKVKVSNQPAPTGGTSLVQIGNSSSSNTDSAQLRLAQTNDHWSARYTDPTPSAGTDSATAAIDGVWGSLIAIIDSDDSRTMYPNVAAATGETTAKGTSGGAWKSAPRAVRREARSGTAS